MTERDFEQVGEPNTVWRGHIVHVDEMTYRYVEDGKEIQREVIRHPGAVGTVAIDDEHVWLVLQPRQAAGDPDMLEIPAGKLDVAGEPPVENARRELAEEIGKQAAHFEPLRTPFFTSCGVLDEQMHLFLATGLSDIPRADSGEDERIEIVPWPLDDLDTAIARSRDAKTIIGLLLLKERLGR
jgi:8-oxo-dGTP pyrophosphatase MutT (NUDIX family)